MKSTRVVVDSSVIVKWLNTDQEENTVQAIKLLQHCQKEMVKLFAPELAKYEVGNALSRKGLTLPMIKAALDTLEEIPIKFTKQSFEDLKNTCEIAENTAMTIYDASFVALAQSKQAKLITANTKHQGKFKEVEVIDIKDYS